MARTYIDLPKSWTYHFRVKPEGRRVPNHLSPKEPRTIRKMGDRTKAKYRTIRDKKKERRSNMKPFSPPRKY